MSIGSGSRMTSDRRRIGVDGAPLLTGGGSSRRAVVPYSEAAAARTSFAGGHPVHGGGCGTGAQHEAVGQPVLLRADPLLQPVDHGRCVRRHLFAGRRRDQAHDVFVHRHNLVRRRVLLGEL
ncbi:MAG: hypothetical protein ABGZ36_13800 [Actinomycetota bacterium]